MVGALRCSCVIYCNIKADKVSFDKAPGAAFRK